MLKQRIAVTSILVLLCGLLVAPMARAQETPVVRGLLFYATTCEHCQWVRREVISPLYQEFGQQLQIMAVEISDESNYQWWLDVGRAYGIEEARLDVPTLFIGDEALTNEAEIDFRLRGLIQAYLERGGVDYPDVPRPGGPMEPTVRFMYFWSQTCPHCTYVREQVFPPLVARYGNRVQWEAYSVEKEDNYLALLELGRRAGLPQGRGGGVPTLLIGDEYTAYVLLIGGYEIEEHLPAVVEWFMGAGGADLPSWKDELFGPALAVAPNVEPAATGAPAVIDTDCPECKDPEMRRQLHGAPEATATPTAQEVTADPAAIHMAYFAEVGCSECDRVSIALGHLQNQFPSLVIHELDIFDDLWINLCLSERLEVPPGQRHHAPAVFVGSDYLVDREIQYERLIEMVARYEETGAEATWASCDEAVSLPPPPPWWAVIVPGLIDGINPCAFATIVFFVSYLTLLERKGREILMVGVSFTLAVFVSYLAFGLILREVLVGLVGVVGPVLRQILNIGIVLVCLVLAILSIDDYRKARRGRVKDMALRLPDRLRKWVNAAVRRSVNARAFVAASFVAGVVVSFIELACTGQVYVPIIQGLSNPAYRAQSTFVLVVYNLAFIAPLVAVFVAAYAGTSSREMGLFLQRHTATVKLATAVLFLGIGLWLVYDVLRIGGVIAL